VIDGFEAQIIVAVATEFLELIAGAVVHGFGAEKEGEGVGRDWLFLEKVGDVAV